MNPQALQGLRDRFRTRALADARALTAALTRGEAGFREIETLVHNLAGSASMLGFPEIGEAALALDAMIAGGEVRPSAVQDLVRMIDDRFADDHS